MADEWHYEAGSAVLSSLPRGISAQQGGLADDARIRSVVLGQPSLALR